MKNILLAVLVTAFATTGLYAQTTLPPMVKVKKNVTPNRPTSKDKLEHGHKPGVIKASAVPAAIRASFEADVEKPTNVKWAKHDSTYEVSYTDWGFQKFSVYYNDTSSTVAEMAVKQLAKTIPDNVKKFVRANYKDNAPMVLYKGYAFRTDASVQKNLDKLFMRIDMADHSLYFDANGNFIKEAYNQMVKPNVAM